MKDNMLLKAKQLIENILPEIIEIRHQLHQKPEIALKEYNTSKLIRKKIEELDLAVLPPFMETDIVAFLNKEKQNKNITFRADIDALPLEEKTELPYKSQNPGFMHACGHDGHTAMLIGTAMVLNELKNELNGSVRFVFQPGEEGVAGGKTLVEKGALTNPKPDFTFAMHGFNALPEGYFSSCPGVLTFAADHFKITVKGKGGHGAIPENTIDSILTAAKIVDGLNHIVSRNISALESGVISICHIESGKNSNVIPDSALIEGTVRYLTEDIGNVLEKRILQTVKGVCESMGADYELIHKKPYIPMVNDAKAYIFGKKVIFDIYKGENWLEADKPLTGAEDFAYFIKNNPGAMFKLGLGEDYTPLHNPHFDFNDNVLKDGIMFFVGSAIKFLN